MFDIGFWELLVIAVVLLLVMGPERLPEVAKQAAFLVRKARQGMYRLKTEMQSEMDATPFGDLQKARDEMTSFKNDIKQFGRDLADSAEKNVGDDAGDIQAKKEIGSDPAKPLAKSTAKSTAKPTDDPTDSSVDT